jgi:addiction module HigA family antidote
MTQKEVKPLAKVTGAVIPYQPDYAVPPGATLSEVLETLEMTQAELARRTGLSAKHINLILKGAASLTPDTALKFERVLNIPARIWNALEANYQGHVSRLDETRGLEEHVGWARADLIKELVNRDCIQKVGDPVHQLKEVLNFFGVASLEAWETIWNEVAPLSAYRLAKQQADPVALAAWMRIGEKQASNADAAPFDRDAFRQVLNKVRGLTRIKDPKEWLPQLQEMCRQVGVIVIIERELPRARVNGVARWLTPNRALILLSARYLRDDILWFTFFHEAAHLLLHGKRTGPRDVPPTFVDTRDSEGHAEDQANEFAANLLIPPEYVERLPRLRSLAEVERLSDELGIAPGIIVGRLHHDGKDPAWGHDLIVRYQW